MTFCRNKTDRFQEASNIEQKAVRYYTFGILGYVILLVFVMFLLEVEIQSTFQEEEQVEIIIVYNGLR